MCLIRFDKEFKVFFFFMFFLCWIYFDPGSLFWFVFESTRLGQPSQVNLVGSKPCQSLSPVWFAVIFVMIFDLKMYLANTL